MEKKSRQSNETKAANAAETTRSVAEDKGTSRPPVTKEQLEAMGFKVLKPSGRGYIPMGGTNQDNAVVKSQRPQRNRPEPCVLPARPNEFHCHFSFGGVPEGILPKSGHGKYSHFLVAVEWAWGPMNNRRDEYHLQGTRTHWVLWTRSYDDNCGKWDWQSLGYVVKTGVSLDTAAAHMLIEYFKWNNGNSDIGPFNFVDRTGFLNAESIEKIRDLVWPR